jgi:heptaprenyl diphosphate synthase
LTDFWKKSPRLEVFLAEVESILDETTNDPTFPLSAETKQLVLSGGKMLRPALVSIGAGFGKQCKTIRKENPKVNGKSNILSGSRGNRIACIAAAIEILHTATLIHDDVLDNADLRRGTRTLHTTFGTTNAILAGDWLFSRSFRLVADNASTENARILSRLVGTVCSAEIHQDLDKFKFDTRRRDYMRTIAGKTAALFALSLHVGASETGTNPIVSQALRRTGYDLGMAFQIMDDILDYESDSNTLRKPVGNDIKEGLCTLPLIFAMETDKALIEPLLKKRPFTDEKVMEILSQVEASGGLSKSRAVAHRFTDRAHHEIASLPDVPARRDLSDLVDRLLVRTY